MLLSAARFNPKIPIGHLLELLASELMLSTKQILTRVLLFASSTLSTLACGLSFAAPANLQVRSDVGFRFTQPNLQITSIQNPVLLRFSRRETRWARAAKSKIFLRNW
jgi:hypothetical protein